MVMAVPMPVVEMAPVMMVPEVPMATVSMTVVPAFAAADLLDKCSRAGGLRGLRARQSRCRCGPGGERPASYDRGANGERFDAHLSSSSVRPGGALYVIQCRKMWRGSVGDYVSVPAAQWSHAVIGGRLLRCTGSPCVRRLDKRDGILCLLEANPEGGAA